MFLNYPFNPGTSTSTEIYQWPLLTSQSEKPYLLSINPSKLVTPGKHTSSILATSTRYSLGHLWTVALCAAPKPTLSRCWYLLNYIMFVNPSDRYHFPPTKQKFYIGGSSFNISSRSIESLTYTQKKSLWNFISQASIICTVLTTTPYILNNQWLFQSNIPNFTVFPNTCSGLSQQYLMIWYQFLF